jgi:hypothetical protein
VIGNSCFGVVLIDLKGHQVQRIESRKAMGMSLVVLMVGQHTLLSALHPITGMPVSAFSRMASTHQLQLPEGVSTSDDNGFCLLHGLCLIAGGVDSSNAEAHRFKHSGYRFGVLIIGNCNTRIGYEKHLAYAFAKKIANVFFGPVEVGGTGHGAVAE